MWLQTFNFVLNVRDYLTRGKINLSLLYDNVEYSAFNGIIFIKIGKTTNSREFFKGYMG